MLITHNSGLGPASSINTKIQRSKARYRATPVASGWAGAVFEVIRSGAVRPKTAKTPKKLSMMDGWTERPTNQRTDRPTDQQSGV